MRRTEPSATPGYAVGQQRCRGARQNKGLTWLMVARNTPSWLRAYSMNWLSSSTCSGCTQRTTEKPSGFQGSGLCKDLVVPDGMCSACSMQHEAQPQASLLTTAMSQAAWMKMPRGARLPARSVAGEGGTRWQGSDGRVRKKERMKGLLWEGRPRAPLRTSFSCHAGRHTLPSARDLD